MNEDMNTGKAFGITAPLGLWSAVFDTKNGNTSARLNQDREQAMLF